MSRKKIIFDRLEGYIKQNDHVSVSCILKWEYMKETLFEMTNDNGLTLTHIACLYGDLKSLEVLLRNGGSVHTRSSQGWSALQIACIGIIT